MYANERFRNRNGGMDEYCKLKECGKYRII